MLAKRQSKWALINFSSLWTSYVWPEHLLYLFKEYILNYIHLVEVTEFTAERTQTSRSRWWNTSSLCFSSLSSCSRWAAWCCSLSLDCFMASCQSTPMLIYIIRNMHLKKKLKIKQDYNHYPLSFCKKLPCVCAVELSNSPAEFVESDNCL